MPCLNEDGTLTSPARALLVFLEQPRTVEEISEALGLSTTVLRRGLREMVAHGFVSAEVDCFVRTPAGVDALKT